MVTFRCSQVQRGQGQAIGGDISGMVDSLTPQLHTLGMDSESARAFLLRLPHVEETLQWGNNLVFWVGDKAIGGKMFCLVNLSGGGHGVVSFAAGAERFHELVEQDGLFPAPYMARIFWIAAERWNALRNSEWEELFAAGHAMTLAKLPPRTRGVLEMPAKERDKLVAAGRKKHAEKAEKEKAAKAKRIAGKKASSKKPAASTKKSTH